MTLISTTTLSGSSTILSSIPQTYKQLYLILSNVYTSASGALSVTPRNASTSNSGISHVGLWLPGNTTPETTYVFNGTGINLTNGFGLSGSNTANDFSIQFINYSKSGTNTFLFRGLFRESAGSFIRVMQGQGAAQDNISSFNIATSAGTFSGGTAYLYGVN